MGIKQEDVGNVYINLKLQPLKKSGFFYVLINAKLKEVKNEEKS